MEKFTLYTKAQLKRMSKSAVIDEYLSLQGVLVETQCERDDFKRRLDKSEKQGKEAEARFNHVKEEFMVFLSKKFGPKSEKVKGNGPLVLPPEVIADAAGLFSALGIKIGATGPENGNGEGNPKSGKEGEGESAPSGNPQNGTDASGKEGDKENGDSSASGKDGEPSQKDGAGDGDGKSGTPSASTDDKKKRGLKGNQKPVVRTAGFMEKYFDTTCRMYVIDGFRYTDEEFREVYGLSENELAYLSNVADLSVTIENIPAVNLVTVHIRPRIRSWNTTLHSCTKGLLHTSILAPSLMSHTSVGKFGMGMPWNRLSKYVEQYGIHIDRGVMSNWTIEVAEKYLKHLTRRMRRLLVKRKVLQGDETYVTVTESEKSNCYFWMVRTSELDDSGPAIILFTFDEKRDEEVIKKLLKGFKGCFMSDGYVCYKELDADDENIISCLCWSHSRRLYIDVLRAIPNFNNLEESVKNSIPAYKVVELMEEIFAAEKEARALDSKTRLKIRNEKIRPLVDKCFAYIHELKDDPAICLPGTLLAKAVNYSLNGEERFRRFLDHANIPLDNNASERCMIQVAVGRNSWRNIDSLRGAEAAAVFYSLYETAVAAKVNPEVYFRYLFELMPTLCENHAAELEDEDNDLAFLDCMMPWSAAYKAYEETDKQIREHRIKVIANALTEDNILHRSPIDKKYIARIIRAQKDQLADLEPLLKDLDADSEEHPEYYKGAVRGAILPKYPLPYVCPDPSGGSPGSPGGQPGTGQAPPGQDPGHRSEADTPESGEMTSTEGRSADADTASAAAS